MSRAEKFSTAVVAVVAGIALAAGTAGAAHGSTALPAQAAESAIADAVVTPATASTPCTSHGAFGSGTALRRVPISAAGSRDCYLIQGNNGAGVSALQTALLYCEGYYIGPGVDGVFGSSTKAGLKNFQLAKGLVVDGEYGNQTHNAIRFSNTIGGAQYCNKDSAI